LLALDLPELAQVRPDRAPHLALELADHRQPRRPDLRGPALTRLGVTQPAGAIPPVTLTKGAGLEMAAGQDRLQGLGEGVEWDELARLEGRAVSEVRGKRLRIGAGIRGPGHWFGPLYWRSADRDTDTFGLRAE
jgi:hypothetical protein